MSGQQISTAKRAIIAIGVVGLTILAAWCIYAWNRPPQMGANEEVFTVVDALFTAVTAQDAKLLGQCDQQLSALHEAGKLPADAAAYLDQVIRTARDGGWQSAAQQLYGFMSVQRRDGVSDQHPKKQKGSSKAGKK